MKRPAAGLLVILLLGSGWGCGLGPRNFRKITHPAPLVRARAMSLGYGAPDSVVLPALLGRLNDPDAVVRLAAHEELKRRTGRDLGYLPWASEIERAGAIERWRSWVMGASSAQSAVPAKPSKSGPRPSPQVP
jgi:hypothetical protein